MQNICNFFDSVVHILCWILHGINHMNKIRHRINIFDWRSCHVLGQHDLCILHILNCLCSVNGSETFFFSLRGNAEALVFWSVFSFLSNRVAWRMNPSATSSKYSDEEKSNEPPRGTQIHLLLCTAARVCTLRDPCWSTPDLHLKSHYLHVVIFNNCCYNYYLNIIIYL